MYFSNFAIVFHSSDIFLTNWLHYYACMFAALHMNDNGGIDSRSRRSQSQSILFAYHAVPCISINIICISCSAMHLNQYYLHIMQCHTSQSILFAYHAVPYISINIICISCCAIHLNQYYLHMHLNQYICISCSAMHLNQYYLHISCMCHASQSILFAYHAAVPCISINIICTSRIMQYHTSQSILFAFHAAPYITVSIETNTAPVEPFVT